jgi:hypothetical protein
MPYSDKTYKIDELKLFAEVSDGGYLYRLASINWAEAQFFLNGGGPLHSSSNGRFHVAHQRTTYCSNNVFVCLSEMLYHMHRCVLDRIMHRDSIAAIREPTERFFWLTGAAVETLNDLVYLDAMDFPRVYGPTMTGTMTIHPDKEYEEFQKVSTRLRGEGKRGVAYPSARHHRDHCFALFLDETDRVKVPTFFRLLVVLRLIGEEHNLTVAPGTGCHPDVHKIHATLGYFEFQDASELTKAIKDKLLNPDFIPGRGFLSFSRLPCDPYSNAVHSV